MINLDKISLTYSQENTTVEVLKTLSLDIHPGESLVIIGPSGCGKSSLLYLLAGLIRPSRGRISVLGTHLTEPRPDTALILQDYGLFPWKSVWENVALGLKIRGIKEIESRIAPILAELGLAEYSHHYPRQLSGGQRQRVAIARALALTPDLLLMDEPLSSLDALTRESMQALLLDIWRKNQLTMVLVTHSIEEAVFLGQKIIIFSPRPAKILRVLENPKVGDPEYRSDPEFFQLCSQIRRVLEEGCHVE